MTGVKLKLASSSVLLFRYKNKNWILDLVMNQPGFHGICCTVTLENSEILEVQEHFLDEPRLEKI